MQTVWGWQPALYIFLGGTGAGLLIMSSLYYLMDQKNHFHLIRTSLYGALLCIAAGLCFLLIDLINPSRGILLWRSFVNPQSWMTWGVWGIAATLLICLISCILTYCKQTNTVRLARQIFAAFSILLGVFVASYTGLLLSNSDGVPFWNSPFLPILFLCSSLSCGCACLEAIGLVSPPKHTLKPRGKQLLELLVVVITCAEILCLFAFMLTKWMQFPTNAFDLASHRSVELLLFGSLSLQFWVIVVTVGLITPIFGACLSLKTRGRTSRIFMISSALCALVGACALRFVILAAGLHPSLVEYALTVLLVQ